MLKGINLIYTLQGGNGSKCPAAVFARCRSAPERKTTYEFYQYALYSVAVHKDRHVDYVKEGIDCRNMMWVCQADQTKTN